ncbi:hypothetical protein [Sphingomonas kyeonggiensis]|uniref:Uncharacterized protein n=1 Tax=Sphingomonas kyeonggiensis TaxID=1268553 RepID=A0A7W6JT76_9SPHN|nr:hypothetical protein [Sphingomonas kyeonggiensis]MBB4098000.1 hypothetical protein [Sphingomonas kyeonggiensis]
MITDMPTADAFSTAGMNQLYLAWQIAMQVVHDHEQITDYSEVDGEEAEAAAAEYWRKSQPALANAFGLTQQAMEMALKGRIVAVSPYLLISRDPKDWPKGIDTQPVPFSEFRTLDAADLIKVHNSVLAPPFDQAFRDFWDGARRDRNTIMHSVALKSFDPATLVRTILTAAETLFADMRWPQRLLEMELDGASAAYGLDESSQNAVMRQIDTAIRHLEPAESRRFFRFDTKRRAYVCPVCYYRANRDWQDNWPALAQFPEKTPGSTSLHCVVCEETTEVERTSCTNGVCPADVLHDGMCLTCMASQDDPRLLAADPMEHETDAVRYHFDFSRNWQGESSYRTSDQRSFPMDDAAIAYGRSALCAAHLGGWDAVTIKLDNPLGGLLSPFEQRDRLLGTWVREAGELVWKPDFEPDFYGIRASLDGADRNESPTPH